ncbi:MAG TPA: tRNA lysidine(34) synthetase TilS, partial [Candidatus Dormibacteraeota bacterium]|nr:tRNA lysidine(34) synthetase TilS [Candidatus Dormibacteraeota bacterium]
AAHLNHRIRALESDRDENFVRELCARLGVELRVARARGLDAGSANLEERARDARYRFLNSAADAIGADYIALAHHADDQAETVLMRMLRGAGIAGLAAMSERGPTRLVRPMLGLYRAEILAYLHARGIAFVEDSSNRSPEILRNRIRTELIPMLERDYAPGLRRRLVEIAGEMRSVDDFMNAAASIEFAAMRSSEDALDIARFSALAPALQMMVLRLYLAERTGSLRRITRSHLESLRRLVLAGGPSDSIDLPGGWRAEREYNILRITNRVRLGDVAFSVPLSLDGITVVEAASYRFEASMVGISNLTPNPFARGNGNNNNREQGPHIALFDAAALADAGLVVRNFIRGDRIHPLGMRGERKVKDVFIDRKIPRLDRRRFPIVTLAGEVAWLPGLARGNAALISNATETILRVEAREIAG